MKCNKPKAGFTITELLIVILVVSISTSLLLPALAKTNGDSMLQESMSNLMTLSVAHVMFAADFNGQQVSYTVDDLSVYGSLQEYNDAHGCMSSFDPGCIPPIIAGWGESGNNIAIFAYWSHLSGHAWAFVPIGFPDGQGVVGFGNFRFGNAKRIHDYVNGRYYDSTFYAPKDTVPIALAAPLFNDPFEFAIEGNPPLWISYVPSPAAMYHPDVMRSNAAGGWQDPWSIDNGFESPGLFQATFPDLKTQMIEHHWLQNGPPVDCNPAFDGPWGQGSYDGCEPYYFNHSLNSSPAALFYDGHIRLLPNTEVLVADLQVLKNTGGVDGLWHRGTSFGIDGYFIPYGFDDVPLSHHILTTDGIMGRDTLGGISPLTGESSYFDRSDWGKSKDPLSKRDDLNTSGDDTPAEPIWSIELLPELQ